MRQVKRRPVPGLFIFIFAALTALLAYLLFFNTGIEIREQVNPFSGGKDVFVVNTTDRVINNVQVKYKAGGEEGDLNAIALLAPKEKRQLDMSIIGERKVRIVVQAPFHLWIEKEIDLRTSTKKPISIGMPAAAEIGKPFEFSAEVCNYQQAEMNVKVEEIHEPLVFFSPNGEDSFTLNRDECRKIGYRLVPGKQGETTIYFNVNFANTNQQFQKVVSVR